MAVTPPACAAHQSFAPMRQETEPGSVPANRVPPKGRSTKWKAA